LSEGSIGGYVTGCAHEEADVWRSRGFVHRRRCGGTWRSDPIGRVDSKEDVLKRNAHIDDTHIRERHMRGWVIASAEG